MRWEWNQAVAEMVARRNSNSAMIDKLIEVRDRYQGDAVIPWVHPDDQAAIQNLSPLIISDAIDHTAWAAMSTAPMIECPALEKIKERGVRSAEYGSKRRQALGWVWDRSWWELLFGRMFRHLAGYASSALVVEAQFPPEVDPRFKPLEDVPTHPVIRARNPLSAYPEPRANEDLELPTNVGFIHGRSLDWLHKTFPETTTRYPRRSAFGGDGSNEVWDILEWYDDAHTMIGVLGPRTSVHSWTADPARWASLLRDRENYWGICPAVVPQRVTLDRIASQVAMITGHADFVALLTYLDVQATQRSIFPDRYIVASSQKVAKIVTGDWKDGSTGQVNILQDVDQIGELRGTPDPNNKLTADRIERNARTSAGVVPQFIGESAVPQLRTGRALDSVMGAAVDPRVAELHKIAARYLQKVNEVVLTALARDPDMKNQSYTVFSGWPGDHAHIDFVPRVHVETVANVVAWPVPGADAEGVTVRITQEMGAGLISAYTARRLHPDVTNPEFEELQIDLDDLDRAFKEMLLTRGAQGGIPPADMARIRELRASGLSLTAAVQQADQEASERQAEMAPPPQPGQVMAPEQMPGLANPGEGAEMQPPPIPAAPVAPGDQLRQLAAAIQAQPA